MVSSIVTVGKVTVNMNAYSEEFVQKNNNKLLF